MKAILILAGVTLLVSACSAPFFSKEPAEPEIPSVTGVWYMESDLQGRTITANLILDEADSGEFTGVWESMDQEMLLQSVTYEEGLLRFNREMGRGGTLLAFEGRVVDGELRAMQRIGERDIPCVGTRFELDEDGPDEVVPLATTFEDEGEYYDELQKDYERNARRAAPRDAFDVLTMPDLVLASAAETLEDEEFVLGVYLDGEARAYPIGALGSSELVNDVCGSIPIAASW